MAFYPICLDLEGKPCTVVGGGKVAERKVLGLLSCSALVTVISPELTDALLHQHAAGRIRWLDREYRHGDLEKSFLVIAATDDEETQKEVYEEAATVNILLNVADVPQRCNFILPATFRQGDLTISVSTSGKSPALARNLRMELEKRYGPEYRVLVNILGVIRPEILASELPQSEKEKLFKKILHDDMSEWIRDRKQEKIAKHLRTVLGEKAGETIMQKVLGCFNE
jgi:precorrin-2 dehydrogenase/sirohydrochlorin ferrochelatase